MSISKEAFDETWANLNKSLNDHKVPEDMINELKEIVYSTAEDIITVKWLNLVLFFDDFLFRK